MNFNCNHTGTYFKRSPTALALSVRESWYCHILSSVTYHLNIKIDLNAESNAGRNQLIFSGGKWLQLDVVLFSGRGGGGKWLWLVLLYVTTKYVLKISGAAITGCSPWLRAWSSVCLSLAWLNSSAFRAHEQAQIASVYPSCNGWLGTVL